MTHTIKGLRAQFKAVGKFHTPPELALFLRSLLPENPRDVYDPTCGAGALLSVFDESTPKYGQDIDQAALDDAGLIPNFTGHLGDVLTDPAFMDKKFHTIAANPPFSIKWEPQWDERFFGAPTIPTQGRADFAFIIHILHMLADDGVAAVLQFPGVLYRGGREQKLRQWMIQENVVDQIISIPGDTFTDTAISTACIVLRKDRGATDMIHMIDQEHDLTRDVPVDEIQANDYSLSVSTYVQPPVEEKPAVDPLALQEQIVEYMITNLTSGLKVQKHVCQLESIDFEPIRQRVMEAVKAA